MLTLVLRLMYTYILLELQYVYTFPRRGGASDKASPLLAPTAIKRLGDW